MATAQEIKNVLSSVQNVKPERVSGCGIVYVVLPKEYNKALKEACEGTPFLFRKKPHGVGVDALRVGCDNASGLALAQGTAIVEGLKALGIRAYRDEVSD